MSSAISNAGLFLIHIFFDLYLMILMVRLILFWVGGNYFNPIIQVILKLTNPVITPLRRFIPNIKKLETATLIILLLIEIIKYSLIGFIMMGFPNSIVGLLLIVIADSVKLLIDIFFYAILLQAIMSWVRAGHTAISDLLLQITTPLMRPFRRFVPLIAGIDVSPIPALILLQLMIILFVNPLMAVGTGMAF